MHEQMTPGRHPVKTRARDQIGAALHDRFEAMHADGVLITAENSARSLFTPTQEEFAHDAIAQSG